MLRKEIDKREVWIGRIPLVEHPDDLQSEGNPDIYRLRPEQQLNSLELLMKLFYRVGAIPCLRLYEAVPHGEKGFSYRLNAADEVLFMKTLLAWPQIKRGNKNAVLGMEAELGTPRRLSNELIESFLFVDLDGLPNEENLCWIEDRLAENHFRGAVVSTGGSFHYIGLSRVLVGKIHLFYSRLFRVLTPDDAPARDKILRIAEELENAGSVEKVIGVMTSVLNEESEIHIPSEGTGFRTGSFIDVRNVARAYERTEGCLNTLLPIFVLRFSDKPGRPVPNVVSLIY